MTSLPLKKDVTNFYIIIQNRSYRHADWTNDYHIEKVSEKHSIKKIIENEVLEYFDLSYFLIITNDETLTNKYLFTINLDEFKMLCNVDYQNEKIRINKDFFSSFNDEVYSYVTKILKDELISASMNWIKETNYPYDDETIGIDEEYFNGWNENLEFMYLDTPARYKKNSEDNIIFSFKNYKSANLETIKKIVNINILEIENNPNPSISWEWRQGMLRYYDKVSSTRFYITEKFLNDIKNNNMITFDLVTKLDKNLYIEYFVVGIKKEEWENDDENERETESNSSYEKYNGVYGLDDNTIDNAFDGDSEMYWNID